MSSQEQKYKLPEFPILRHKIAKLTLLSASKNHLADDSIFTKLLRHTSEKLGSRKWNELQTFGLWLTRERVHAGARVYKVSMNMYTLMRRAYSRSLVSASHIPGGRCCQRSYDEIESENKKRNLDMP